MYDRKQIKFEAKESLNANLGLAIGVSVVYALIASALGSAINALSIIFVGVLGVGVAIVYLAITRGTPVEFTDMFNGFKNFGPNCLAGVLVGVFTFLWSLLFVIPGIIKAYSYSMTYYILADHPEMTAREAIDESCRIMNGHKFDLFVLQLSFFWWILLCTITFGIGFIYVGPYMSAATAKFYDTIKEPVVIEL